MEAPVLIGGGGHARAIVAMAPDESKPSRFVDPCDNMAGLEWLGNDDDFLGNDRFALLPVIISLVTDQSYSMEMRRKIIEKYSGRKFATIVASDAVVETDSVLGEGCAVFHKAVVNTGAVIGRHSVVNTGAIVEHDCHIGDNVFLGPGAIVCGEVSIGNNCYVGAGAVLKNGITIPDNTIIGMGSVVTKTLRVAGFYFGNRAKRIK